MKLPILLAAGLACATIASVSAPDVAVAQSGSFPTLTIFGEDPCPRDTICVRAPENERYRIPKELRGDTGLALAERWGDRARSIEYVGASGVQSCSPVGPGGATGCFNKIVREARAEQKARGEEPTVPLNLP